MITQPKKLRHIKHLELTLDMLNRLYYFDSRDMDILISYASFFIDDNGGQSRDALAWLKRMNGKLMMNVSEIPLADMKGWHFDQSMNLMHESGRFFSIQGVKVSTNTGQVKEWDQPIIHQPEIGILGFICQKQEGVLKFLVQAKIEPGNINHVMLSPTVQATKSNFTQAHNGKRPEYLKYFIDLKHANIIVDQLQSEQGSRFLKKRNRNIILEIDENEDMEVLENYYWLSLGQIKYLLQCDNLVNMDARSVLSCLKTRMASGLSGKLTDFSKSGVFNKFQWDLIQSLMNNQEPIYTKAQIISWFTNLKTINELSVEDCGLKDLRDWIIGDKDISHKNAKYFQVIGVKTVAESREVASWCQPMIKQYDAGIVGFLIKKFNNIYHVLIQAKMEVGNFDILEMAPTVQCITGSYINPEYTVPFLDFFTERKGVVHYDNLQSEEGGRFFREQNRYMVIEVDDGFEEDINDRYIWMTLRQIKEFIQFNNYLNIEARSLLTCLLPI